MAEVSGSKAIVIKKKLAFRERLIWPKFPDLRPLWGRTALTFVWDGKKVTIRSKPPDLRPSLSEQPCLLCGM